MSEMKRREVMVGTYLPQARHAELKKAAKSDRRSIAAFLALLIERELERRRKAA